MFQHFRLLPMIAAFVLCLLLSAPVLAQTGSTGSLEGVVKDTTAAVMPDAKVTLTNVDTGVARSAKTSNVGHYSFPALQPGRYQVNVEKEGFQKFSQQLRIQTAVKSTVDATLAVGEVKQTANVSAEGPVLETASASLGSVLTSRSWICRWRAGIPIC